MEAELKRAAMLGNVEYLKEVIASTTDSNKLVGTTSKGYNILHIAVRFRRERFLEESIKSIQPKQVLLTLLAQQEPTLKWNPLHFAAFQANVKLVKVILDLYKQQQQQQHDDDDYDDDDEDTCPWLAPDVDGRTPLHLVLSESKKPVSERQRCGLLILSMDSALLGMVDNDAKTPLYLAVQHGLSRVAIEILVSNTSSSCTPTHQAERCCNPLQYLAEKSGVQEKNLEESAQATDVRFEEDEMMNLVERLLIKTHPEFLEGIGEKKNSMLHIWAKTGKLWQLSALEIFLGIENLQRLSCLRNSEGDTPLHIALEHSSVEFALHLVTRCRELRPPLWSYENIEGITPFGIALRKRQTDFILHWDSVDPWTVHKEQESKESRLFIAVREGMDEVVQKVCAFVKGRPSLSANIPATNTDNGQTVLHVITQCTEHTGKLLVEAFKHLINEPDKSGKIRPLDVASEACEVWLIESLLSLEPSAITHSPKAWLTACRNGNLEAIKVFTQQCDMLPALCETVNDSPLHHIEMDNETAYEEFLAISPIWEMKNFQDSDGKTPLHRALEREDMAFAEVLLKKGVDTSISYKNGARKLLATLREQQYKWHQLCQRLNINPRLKTRFIQDTSALGKLRDTLAVVAALLATLTFAAGFTLPGGLDQDSGESTLAKRAPFIVFILADAYALCSSMVVLFSLIWSMVSDELQSHVLIDRSVLALIHSFIATLVAFMTGIYTVISHKSLWVAIVIIVMVSLVAIVSWNKIVLYTVLDQLIPSEDRDWKKKLQSWKQVPGRLAKHVLQIILCSKWGYNSKKRDPRLPSAEESVTNEVPRTVRIDI